MAFLDNSGDIILDAVLTDLGRQKMAAGTLAGLGIQWDVGCIMLQDDYAQNILSGKARNILVFFMMSTHPIEGILIFSALYVL